jgi:anti-anti-sigma factor
LTAQEPNSEAPFGVDVSESGDTFELVVSGELDMTTVPEFEAALAELPAGPWRVVIDLRGVSFMDSAGVHAFIRLDRRARDAGWALVLVRGPGMVARVLEVCRVSDRITVVDGSESGA